MRLKSLFSRDPAPDDSVEKEYSFIWYKEMRNQGVKHFTTPFRTTVKAKSREEAVNKLTAIVLSTMKLVIVDADKYDKTQLGNLMSLFRVMRNKMEEFFNV